MTDKNKPSSEQWETLPSHSAFNDMNEAQLRDAVNDCSRLWLAHDGLWFQAVENMHGMDDAIKADTEAWRIFTTIEAKRILARMNVEPGTGGIDELALALRNRLYANINTMTIERCGNTLRMTMVDCRVQSARKKKNLDFFPCKSVGLVEYSEFARTINPKFKTSCGFCPPDKLPSTGYCQWIFELEE